MGINSNNPPEIQTDKAKTKVVHCAIADCGQPLIVNTFYAPARARCSRHRDSPVLVSPESKEVAQMVSSAIPPVVTAKLPAPPVENHSLERLCCPFGHGYMTILRIDAKMGFMTFKCGECKTAVEVMPAWAPLLMKVVPEDLLPIVQQFNKQMLERGAVYVESEGYRRSLWSSVND